MLFKNFTVGQPVYIFDRVNLTLIKAKVTNVTPSHVSNNPVTPTYNPMQFNYQNPMNSNMVVDVTVESEGSSKVYTFKDSTEIGYTDSLVISGERDLILKEVGDMKSQSEDALKQVDLHKERISKCTNIIAEFSPEVKEKKLMEDRFHTIETSMADMSKTVNNLAKSVQTLVDEFHK
jgi:hypothetical protein